MPGSECEWRNVPGLEDRLMVSSKGDLWYKWRPRIGPGIAPRPGLATLTTKHPWGHKYIFIRYPDGVKRRLYVHRAVALAFIPRDGDNDEVCHKNDIPSDNQVENLYWGTKRSNGLDSMRNGRHAAARMTACGRGHEYNDENTLFTRTKNGGTRRTCRVCARERYHAKNALAQKEEVCDSRPAVQLTEGRPHDLHE